MSERYYKIVISIAFGLVGFFLNFHTMVFPFGETTVAILLGLVFPLLIALSWGWRFGLLSAIFGGCQSMWWLWGPSNGYAVFLIVPPFTFWIIWHGIFSALRNKQTTPKWWLNMYIVEIPFRVLSSINLYTFTRWAISFNPPPWSWADSSLTITPPMHFSTFFVVKQAVCAFIILLLADVLLSVRPVRAFFRLRQSIDHQKTGYIVSIFLLLGCLFWLMDSFFHAFAFHDKKSFFDLLALDIPEQNLFTRSFFFLFCVVSGLVTAKIIRRQRESESRYRLLADNVEDVIWRLNLNEKFTYISPSICRLRRGGTFEEAQKLSLEEMLTPESYTKAAQVLKEEIACDKEPGTNPNRTINLELELIRHDGSTVSVEVTASFLRKDDDNSITELLGIARDISSRKVAEYALQESKDKLQLIIDNSPIGICSNDLFGNFVSTNLAYERLLGYSKEELKELSFFDVTHPDYRPKNKELFQKMVSEKSGFYMEKIYVRKDGTEVNVSVYVTAVKDDQGNTKFGTAFVEDITERKQAERTLTLSKQLIDNVINNIADPVFVKDEKHRWIILNDSFCRMLGQDREALLGGSDFDFFPKYQADIFWKRDNVVMTSNKPDINEEEISLGEQKRIIATTKSSFTNPITGKRNLVGTIRDITDIRRHSENLEILVDERTREIKETQKELLQKERLATLGELAGSVAHDIRNPLGSISNSIYFLNQTIKDTTDTKKTKKHISIMQEEIKRANRIITDLLDFSRENNPDKREGKINDVLSKSLGTLAIPENTTVETSLDQSIPIFSFDPSQLERVFNNLLLNALHAMPSGGYLHISTTCSKKHVKIKVQDTGPGISADNLDAIFEPLYTTKSKGVGLGLSIAKIFIEKHNGMVEVESETGKGTTFTVQLPITQPKSS